jgi:hypothetical protein
MWATLLHASAVFVSSPQAGSRFGVDWDTIWSVPPLPLPDPSASVERCAESEAVRLFVERARAVAPECHYEQCRENTPGLEVGQRCSGDVLAKGMPDFPMREIFTTVLLLLVVAAVVVASLVSRSGGCTLSRGGNWAVTLSQGCHDPSGGTSFDAVHRLVSAGR